MAEEKKSKISLKKNPVVGFNKPMGLSLTIQHGGGECTLDELKARAMDALRNDGNLLATGAKVTSIALYAKPEDGKCYYVAQTTRGEASGAVDL